jgi:hypothetical protein
VSAVASSTFGLIDMLTFLHRMLVRARELLARARAGVDANAYRGPGGSSILEERGRFWTEFREGQREAELRLRAESQRGPGDRR